MRRPYAFRIALGSVLPQTKVCMAWAVTAAAPVQHPLRCAAGCVPGRRFGEPAQVRRLAEIPPTAQQKSAPTAPQKLPAKVSPPGTPLADARGGARTGSRRRTARGGACPNETLIARRAGSAALGLRPSDLRHTPQIRRSQANGGASPRPIPNSAEISSLYTKQPPKNRKFGRFRLDGFEKFCYSISI